MGIELDRAQGQIRRAATEFARGEFDREEIRELEKVGEFPTRIWKAAAELGFLGLHLDEAGGGILESLITAEAFCREDSACGMALTLAGCGAELVRALGNPDQKAAVVEPVTLGAARCGAALFEAGRGLEDYHTQARPDGSGWIISGEKTQVANGLSVAGETLFFPVLCRAPEGPTLVLLDARTPGVGLSPTVRRLGNNLSPSAEMVLEDVRVPANQILGKPGKAWKPVQAFLDQLQLLNAGMALGMAQGALDRALAYGKQRQQFGRPVLAFEALAHTLAEMELRLGTARSLVYDMARAWDSRKKNPPAGAALAMEAACRAAEYCADAALQIHGGYGYMTEGEIEQFYRDAKWLKLHATNPAQRLSAIAAARIGTLKPGPGKE